MAKKTNDTPKRTYSEDTNLKLKYILKTVEFGEKKSILQLKQELDEARLYFIGLKYVSTSNKAICEALSIPVEAGCRYKRKYEKSNLLVSSAFMICCPCTKHFVHCLSTDSSKFDELLTRNDNQLSLF